MDADDVIIIGTGAGGGTLARHLAPSGKRVNPALTAMANALRVGDHLLERLDAASPASAAVAS